MTRAVKLHEGTFFRSFFHMDDQIKTGIQIIGGGLAWFFLLLAGFSALTALGGGLYLGFLGCKIYH